MTTGAKSEWDNFGGGNRGMSVDDFSDLFLVGIVDLSADAGRGRIIDLGLDVVNEPGLVRAVEFIQDGVTAETIQRAISNSVVALDFAFVEVISFRDNTETRPSVALDIVLHAFNS